MLKTFFDLLNKTSKGGGTSCDIPELNDLKRILKTTAEIFRNKKQLSEEEIVKAISSFSNIFNEIDIQNLQTTLRGFISCNEIEELNFIYFLTIHLIF